MPNTFTTYMRDLLLRSVLTPDIYVAPPTTIEVALTRTVAPNNASVAQLVEPTAALYARQSYSLLSTHWAPTGFGEFYNTMEISWAMVMLEEWGPIAGWALIDPVADRVLNTGSVIAPYQAVTGMTPKLAPGTIVLGIYD